MTTITDTSSVTRIDARIAELADAFATVKRHRYGARSAHGMTAYRECAALASVDGGIVVMGGTPETMAQAQVPDGAAEWGASMAVPYDAVANAAKGARKLRAVIMPGRIEREDGATFTWQDSPEAADTLIDTWRTLCDRTVTYGERDRDLIVGYETSAQALRDAVSITAKASSRDEARPILCGIALIAVGGRDAQMRVAATDSYRLHACMIDDCDVSAENDGSVIILPTRVAETLAKARNVDGAVIIGTRNGDGEHYRAEMAAAGKASEPALIITGRAYGGQYPNVDALLDQPGARGNHPLIADCDGEALAQAAKAAADLIGNAARTWRPVRMYVERDQSAITLEVVATDDLPGAQWTIPTRTPIGGALVEPDANGVAAYTVGVNSAFLRDAALSIGTDDIIVNVYGPTRPLIIEHGEQHRTPGCYGERCIVMPVRIH